MIVGQLGIESMCYMLDMLVRGERGKDAYDKRFCKEEKERQNIGLMLTKSKYQKSVGNIEAHDILAKRS